DPSITTDYINEIQRIDPIYHHLLGMEFLPIISVMGFTAPVLHIMENQALHLDVRSTWSAAVDADLSRLALLLSVARTGDLPSYRLHRDALKTNFWYKAYHGYLQGLCYAAGVLAGTPEPEFASSFAHFPGLRKAIGQ
ncbi:MAG: hypothetical protein ACO28T_06215, partial [Schleiferiaceae bacterium]